MTKLKITNLPVECIEKIFAYMDYSELIEIAHTNKKLKPAADGAFKRKFGKEEFELHLNRPKFQPKVAEDFIVYKIITWLRLLRCYGHLISALKISTYKPNCRPPIENLDRDLKLAFRYVKEFCSKSLTKISLSHIPKDVFYLFDGMIVAPFEKVEVISMLGCNLATTNTNFNAWFPAMRHLALYNDNDRFAAKAAIENHFPNLEYLCIVGSGQRMNSIRTALHLNPKLTSIHLEQAYSPQLFRYVNKLMPQLACLTLRGEPNDFAAPSDEVINFKTVKKVEMKFFDRAGQTLSNIQASFSGLEDITFDMGMCDWDAGLNNFLQRHQSIVKVTVRSLYDNEQAINETILREIVQTLPQLKELNFFGINWPIKMINFLIGFNLTKYSFSIENPLQFDDLKIRLGIQYRASIDGTCVQLEKNM